MVKMDERGWRIFDVFLVSFLITINLFFGIFAWNPNDLSPNQALGLISLIFIIMQFIRIFGSSHKHKEVKKK